MSEQSAAQWAQEEFGGANLGHGSRRTRLVKMACTLATSAAGTVTDSFANPAERQGAYCFLQNGRVDPSRILESMQRATALRTVGERFAYVPVDGSSVSVVDRAKVKNFGGLGSYNNGGRGLKVMGAIAVSPTGIPLGVTALEWWTRPSKKASQRASHENRKTQDKETKYWLRAIRSTVETFAHTGTHAWFQLDREADSWPVLEELARSGHSFTVRSNHDRRLLGGSKYLHRCLRRCKPLGHRRITLQRARGRTKQDVTLAIRTLSGVPLRLKDRRTKKYKSVVLNAVYAKQVDGPHKHRLSWILLTNRPVSSLTSAMRVVFGYCQRWRIEDFHKSWKSGHCHVEKTQLRTTMHVRRWATILAAVAMRVERLKHLARQEPDQPATIELTKDEVEVLIAYRKQNGKRTDNFEEPLTIEKAVLWIAEVGGYMGNPKKGRPPGSIVIGRGLQKIAQIVHGYLLAKAHLTQDEID